MNTTLLDGLWQEGRDFLGVRYPILCGAMTWISDATLVTAVSKQGGFASLAAGNMPGEALAAEIAKTAAQVKGSFAVNLVTIAPNFPAHKEAVLQSSVPIVIFAGNFPKKHDVAQMKEAGKKVLSFASTDSIADQMVRFGVDGLILEGSEAGGHIGHVSTMILLQQVLFHKPNVPVFVGGGIATGRMLAHMILMGAAGVQMGTRFVMSAECNAHPKLKERFVRARAREAMSTPEYDKRLPIVAVRALKNKSTEAFGRLQLELLQLMNEGKISHMEAQYRVEGFWMGGLRKAAVEGDVDYGSCMAGQSVGLVDKIQPMSEIFAELLQEGEAELASIQARLAGIKR
ncbi:MAG TPA: nitronate monooxygenase [Kiritimatiellia bacterium]|nr:nitronate monooxygenase [Kiritimatiellia bacterium]MBP9571946.1 nitronate monooxygenase [Kiritimatiellia bacterium]HQF21678.1 nitronate monooxygenase [Kiritimatiellia bacterium]HQG75776.1 nitronate monooxygenase [Kiritimatiellia bacterium]